MVDILAKPTLTLMMTYPWVSSDFEVDSTEHSLEKQHELALLQEITGHL